jgi:hypothetical protein
MNAAAKNISVARRLYATLAGHDRDARLVDALGDDLDTPASQGATPEGWRLWRRLGRGSSRLFRTPSVARSIEAPTSP